MPYYLGYMTVKNTNISDRKCPSCKHYLPESSFYVYRGRYQSKCKKCHNSKSREWEVKNRERTNARRRTAAKVFGWTTQRELTPDERNRFFKRYYKKNKPSLVEHLKSTPCSSCGATANLVAKHQGVNLSSLTERSSEGFHYLLSNSIVKCTTCSIRERREEWRDAYNPDELRSCKHCMEEKRLSEFAPRHNPDKIRTCKDCHRLRAKLRSHEKKQECRDVVADLKKSPCTDCGLRFDPVAMDFDHLPEFEKVANVSELTSRGSMKNLLAELEKCELVCSNCHRVRTRDRTMS